MMRFLQVSTGLCLLSGISLICAQGTDRDHPLPLPASELTGKLSVHEKTEVFYRLFAGPGDFRALVDSVGDATDTTVTFEDLDAKTVANVRVVSSPASARKVGRFQVSHPSNLIMIVQASSWGGGSYHVRLEGPVNLAGATAVQTSSPPVDAKAAQQDGDATRSAETPTLRVVLPRRGMLTVELEDGTVTRVDLQKVRRVSVQP